MKIHKGHQGVMPYLILKNAEGFIEFTKTVLNATEIFKSYREGDPHQIMHSEVQINGCNIMCADVTEDFDVANANLFVYVEDADTTCQLALDKGSTLVTEVADQDYGRSGGFKDPWGNVWWVTSLK